MITIWKKKFGSILLITHLNKIQMYENLNARKYYKSTRIKYGDILLYLGMKKVFLDKTKMNMS